MRRGALGSQIEFDKYQQGRSLGVDLCMGRIMTSNELMMHSKHHQVIESRFDPVGFTIQILRSLNVSKECLEQQVKYHKRCGSGENGKEVFDSNFWDKYVQQEEFMGSTFCTSPIDTFLRHIVHFLLNRFQGKMPHEMGKQRKVSILSTKRRGRVGRQEVNMMLAVECGATEVMLNMLLKML